MKKNAGYAVFLALLASVFLTSCITTRDSTYATDYEQAASDLRNTLFSALSSLSVSEEARLQSFTSDVADPLKMDSASVVSDPAEGYVALDISFIAAGDNLIHPNLYLDAYNRGNEEKRYDFLPLYANVASLIAAADFSYINQETPMAGEAYGYSGWPTFNSPQQLGKDLTEIGFDIVNVANNHMLDKGASGYASTLDFWHTQPVTLIGGYYNEEDAAEIRTVEKDGVTIALLSYTYGTNSIALPANSELVVPYIDDALIVSDLARAQEISDFIIVSIHWGDENTQTVNAEQLRLAQLLADNGADVILGSHSHTLQPLTWLTSQTTGKEVLCIYSLGNFVSGMSRPINMVGGLLSFHIRDDETGALRVEDVLFTPTVTYYGGDWYDTHIYLLEEYTDEIAAAHGVRYQGGYLSPEQAREYVTNVVPTEFLPDFMK